MANVKTLACRLAHDALFGSTGCPVACHSAQPPTSARAFGHPAVCSSRATRALVSSFAQAQYATSQSLCGSASSAAARATLPSGDSRIALLALSSLSR